MNIKRNQQKLCYKLHSVKSCLKNLFNRFKTDSYYGGELE